MNILSEKNADAMTIIDLRYFEKKSFKEIGIELDITDLNAKIRTYRALDKLKKVFNSTK
jgi:RNA polymerase sigma-70 factor (ECF subfamily)